MPTQSHSRGTVLGGTKNYWLWCWHICCGIITGAMSLGLSLWFQSPGLPTHLGEMP